MTCNIVVVTLCGVVMIAMGLAVPTQSTEGFWGPPAQSGPSSWGPGQGGWGSGQSAWSLGGGAWGLGPSSWASGPEPMRPSQRPQGPESSSNPWTPPWVSSDPWITQTSFCTLVGSVCVDCKTRFVCTKIGALTRACKDPKHPYCNDGACSATATADCTSGAVVDEP